MPRLHIFAVCREAILDQETGNLSIISIIGGLSVSSTIFTAADMPSDAIIPLSWTAVSLWLYQPDDAGKTWSQKVEIFKPDGSKLDAPEASSNFVMTNQFHAVKIAGEAFPVDLPGTYNIKLFVKEFGSQSEWAEAGSHPLQITYG